MASELQGGKARQIRIGASTIVLRDHLPDVFQNMRKRFPNLKISLREGYPAEFENLLQKEELDLAVTAIEKKPRARPALGRAGRTAAGAAGGERAAGSPPPTSFGQRDKIEEPLICLPAAEAICKNFQQGLTRLGVDWFPGMEVSSVDLIETYVANGFGIGVSVQVPKAQVSPNVRVVPLPDFAPVVVGVLWRGKTSALLQAFLDEIQLRAKRFALNRPPGKTDL